MPFFGETFLKLENWPYVIFGMVVRFCYRVESFIPDTHKCKQSNFYPGYNISYQGTFVSEKPISQTLKKCVFSSKMLFQRNKKFNLIKNILLS
jgi:hypothetical protein